MPNLVLPVRPEKLLRLLCLVITPIKDGQIPCRTPRARPEPSLQENFLDHEMERFDATLRIALSQMQNLQTTICPYCTSSNPHFSRLCATCGSRLQNTILPIGLRLKDGFYELEGVLGQGGFGITYLARHTGLGTKVALKELYPDNLVMRDSSGKVRAQAGMQPEFESLKIRFSREAKTLRELNHKCSTKFISDWEERGTVFIAMEFIDGETLESRIARGALLTEREAREVMLPILELLEVVHSKGLLHRDIKPANIILTKNGGVELIDFGSVTKFSANQRSKITSRLLTPAYAPLEQYGQEVMLTPSTDLYALAATMYEAVTGKAPPNALERANGAMMYLARLVEPTISREFSEVLDKALELRMEDRYSSAVEFLFGLSSIKSSLSQIGKTSQSPMRQHVPQYLQNSSKFSRNQKTFDIPNYRIFIYGLFIFLILLYKIISPTIC